MKVEHLSLSQVIDKFKAWRASRKKQSRISDHLWKHVIPLLSDHPRSAVLRRLGISSGQLKKHLNRQNPKPVLCEIESKLQLAGQINRARVFPIDNYSERLFPMLFLRLFWCGLL